MSAVPDRFGFHAILSRPLMGYIKLATLLIQHDIPFLQLRCKELSMERTITLAKQLRELTRKTRTRLILHDDPELVREVDADGVHLSRKAVTYSQARHILGPDKIVGLSCLTVDHVVEADQVKPDYIGVGPVWSIPENPDPPIGLEGLSAMRVLSRLPAIAIGGIDTSRLAAVKAAGALNVTVIRELNDSDHPQKVLETIRLNFPW